jgi:hypothetical protein
MPTNDRSYGVDFDSSLKGAGVILRKMIGGVWTIIRVLRVRYCYVLTYLKYQSSLQNTFEFIAAIIGLVCAIKYGARDGHIRIQGDSETALRWLETWKFKSGPSNNAAIVYVALGLKYNLRLDDIVFIKGSDNVTCDDLSREKHPSELGFDESLHSDEEDEDITRLLALCTPSDLITPSHDFVTKWIEATAFAASLESTEEQGL